MLICSRLNVPGLITCVLAVQLGAADHLAAQGVTPAPPAPVWEIRTAPDVDLWYHGLAVIGFRGFGPLPMYDPGYASMVRTEKIKRGSQPSILDRNAALLKAAFSRDSAFEVMHFLPLYFLAPGNGDAIPGLRAVARGKITNEKKAESGNPPVLAAVAGVIRTRRQRELLGMFIDGLEDERRAFYDDFTRRNRESRRKMHEAFSTYWNDSLSPSIAPFLNNVAPSGGSIILSPPLGGEGRSIKMRASPTSAATIVVVGSSYSGTDLHTPAVSLVRELCFPIVRRAIEPVQPAIRHRIAAERLSSIAAVRCGAQAMERHIPSLLAPYMLRFLAAADRPLPHRNLDSAFRSAFPVSGAIDASLRRALAAH